MPPKFGLHNPMKERDPVILELRDAMGSFMAIAEACGVSSQAISQWRSIPVDHVVKLERLSGIPRERLRPDIFGAPRPRPRRAASTSSVAA